METLRILTYQAFAVLATSASIFTYTFVLAPTWNSSLCFGGLALLNWAALVFFVGVWVREQRSLKRLLSGSVKNLS